MGGLGCRRARHYAGNWFEQGWQGWCLLPGAAFPPSAHLKATTRHLKRMEVWAIDSVGLVHGDWFAGS